MNPKIIIILLLLGICSCSSTATQEEKKESGLSVLGSKSGKPTEFFFPAGEKEMIINEAGQEVKISDLDPEPFRQNSKNPNEYFRVVMTSDSYMIRQIRGASVMRRKPDPGGDQLIMEEIAKYNLIDKVDDGLVKVKLNPRTGKLENVNFHTRIPRIHDLAKIIQNDSTRWVFEHKNENEPAVTNFLVTYYIVLRNKASRDEVKGLLKKQVH